MVIYSLNTHLGRSLLKINMFTEMFRNIRNIYQNETTDGHKSTVKKLHNKHIFYRQ